MNEVFKKLNSERIELDKRYSLEPDGFRGLVLVLEEKRVREKVDAKTKKKTGETEEYIYTDKWYHPKLSQSLSKYLQLTASEAKSIGELRDVVLRVENKIASIKENWN